MTKARDIADNAGQGGGGGSKNLIINGAMQVAQRGTSVTGNNSSGYLTCDRWNISGSIGTRTVTQQADAPEGFYNSYKVEITTAETSPSAGLALAVEQRMEGQNLQMLKKGTANALSVTVSFWVKSNKTGTYILEIDDNDNSRNINKSYTVSSSGVWEYKTITFEGDTTGSLNNDNAHSLRVFFWLDAGSNFRGGTLATSWESTTNANRAEGNVTFADTVGNTWQITGVQLEVGDKATDFEHRTFGDELAKCQRYYEVIASGSSKEISGGNYYNSSSIHSPLFFNTKKRSEAYSLDYVSGSNYYRAYRNGSADDFTSFTGLARKTFDRTLIYAQSGISGSAGHGIELLTNNSAAYVAIDDEL